MNAQMTIQDAIAAGEHAMGLCLEKAEDKDPGFGAIAREAILAHLRVVKRCSGEELVNVARAKGARPHDDRAFGGIFQSLSRGKLIRHAGYCLRTKGHGTAGGRLWELCE